MRVTCAPVSCRGCRRMSLARKSSRLCRIMKPSVSGIRVKYVQRIHFTTGMRGTGRGPHVHRPNDEVLTRAGVTSSARLRKVRGIHRGARVGRPEDIVHSVAGSTVGHALRSASHGQTVIAVGERRNSVGRQIVAQRQAFIAVASPAGGHRDPGCVHQRSLLLRPQDQVFSVAVAAHRRTRHAILHGLSVYAFKIRLGDVGVALSAGCRDIEVVDLGTRILRGQDSVASVTIRAGCGRSVSIHHGSSMHALLVEFHGMREWNLVSRRETAGCCGRRRKCPADFSWLPSRPHRSKSESDAPVHGRRRNSVHPDRLPQPLVRVCFAGIPSLHRHDTARTSPAPSLGRRRHFVVIAVAGLAGRVTERAVHAIRHMGSLVSVAGRALNLRATLAGCG